MGVLEQILPGYQGMTVHGSLVWLQRAVWSSPGTSGRPKHSDFDWKAPPTPRPLHALQRWTAGADLAQRLLRALSIEARALPGREVALVLMGPKRPVNLGTLPEKHTWESCTLFHRTISNFRQSEVMDGTFSV